MKSDRIAALEHELSQARAEAAAETRAQHVNQLRKVTRELEEKEVALAQLNAQVKLENELIVAFNRRIVSLQAAFGQSAARRPASAAWLTADEDIEVAQWEREHKQYETALANVIAERNALPLVDRAAAITLAEQVQYLRHSKLNLMNLLDGSINRIEGGIFSV